MEPSNWTCILAIIFLSVGAEIINGMSENQLEDLGHSMILQKLEVHRNKRSPGDGCCKNSGCKKQAVIQPQPIVVNHYHNYYYNCPCVPQPTPPPPPPQSPAPVCSPESTCVDCTCDKSGAISCSVPESQTSNYQKSSGSTYQQSPQTGVNTYQNYSPAGQRRAQAGEAQRQDISEKDKNTAFTFSMLFDDPIAKNFYDFVTTNFVKRDTPLEVAEIRCETVPLHVLEDPICKEFFDLFTQTFVRKTANTTSSPELSNTSTQKPK